MKCVRIVVCGVRNAHSCVHHTGSLVTADDPCDKIRGIDADAHGRQIEVRVTCCVKSDNVSCERGMIQLVQYVYFAHVVDVERVVSWNQFEHDHNGSFLVRFCRHCIAIALLQQCDMALLEMCGSDKQVVFLFSEANWLFLFDTTQHCVELRLREGVADSGAVDVFDGHGVFSHGYILSRLSKASVRGIKPIPIACRGKALSVVSLPITCVFHAGYEVVLVSCMSALSRLMSYYGRDRVLTAHNRFGGVQ